MCKLWLKVQTLGTLVSLAILAGGCGPDGELAPAAAARRMELTASRCQVFPSDVICTDQELSLTALLVRRKVTYEVPIGTPPPGGWPTVLYFQGSFFAGSRAFAAGRGEPF